MTHPLDVAIMIQAIRTSETLLATKPFQGFVERPFGAVANATTDQELEAYMRDGSVSFSHICCTAKMGTLKDEVAVVDPTVRLKGAKGLRVVDASVLVTGKREIFLIWEYGLERGWTFKIVN